jgi:hypothetical protein
MATLLSSFFSARAAAPETDGNVHAERDERKREIERILAADDELRVEVEKAKASREQQDRVCDQIESDLMKLAEIGSDGYAAELQKRTATRMELGRVLLRQREYRERNNLPMLRAELQSIVNEEDADERAAARARLIELLLAFDAEILQPAIARQQEIDALFEMIERKWPSMRTTLDLPRLPVGVFTAMGGLRSISNWHHEVLALAEPTLFPADDPAREKAEEQRKTGKPPVVWAPSSPAWG